MESVERLRALSSNMELEPAEDAGCPQSAVIRPEDIPVSEAVLPNGKRIRLLKTLLTSACERDCHYCPFRAGRDFRRRTFQPEGLAQTFLRVHRAGIVEGLFLSSGIAGGGIRTQDRLIAAAEILRRRHGYRGYLHLKLMPGVERAQVEAAMQLADRVSVNLEAPNAARLRRLAPGKVFREELLAPLQWVEEIRSRAPSLRTWNGRWPSSTTQFVVGATGESDLELLQTTEHLYHSLGVRRAYYSPFRPVADTPLEDLPATPTRRETRLYQASFLLRDYGFAMEEMPFDHNGNLPLQKDPKLAWAEANLAEDPVELNHATRERLLRIPGVGPKGVAAILTARRERRLEDLSALGHLGVQVSRAAPYVLLGGQRPARQLRLL